jgi:pilus assembly protein FimV
VLRRAAALLLVVVAAALQLGAAAPGATELAVAPASGAAGSSFTVTVRGFTPGPVVLHWDGAAGDVLGTGAGPEFTVTVTVPDAPAGSHPVFAVADDAEDSAAFEVTSTETPSRRAAVEPVRGDTAVGGGTGAASGADLAGPSTASTTVAGTPAAADSPTVSTAPGAPAAGAGAVATGAAGTPGAPGAAGSPGGDAAAIGGDGASGGQDVPQVGTALAAAPAAGRSGGGRSPILLAVGLAMVLGGGAYLVVHSLRRTSGTG